MSFSSPAAFRSLCLIAVPLLATSIPAGGATVPKSRAPVASHRSIATNNAIIALPLTPIVPSAQRSCGSRTPSGLGYTMLRSAAGLKPAGDATVLVNYIGYLADTGAVFDQGMRSALQLDGVIPGFSQGLQLLARTGVARLCIPAAMGYGAQASGPIPANANLVFQIELLDFKSAAELDAMRKAQTAEPVSPPPAAPPRDTSAQ